MENKIEKIKKMVATLEDKDYVVFSKNKSVMEWTKILASIALIVMDEEDLTSKDMIEIGNHFMATGKALRSAIEMTNIIEQITECLKSENEEANETSGEA